MRRPTETLEMERLHNALEEDRITDAECERLQALLRDNPVAREEYIRLTEISVSLRNYAACPAKDDSRAPSHSGIIAFSFATAAAVMIAAIFLMRGGIGSHFPAHSAFASITWTEGPNHAGWRPGARLGKGSLELMADQQVGITLDGGTTLYFAGPGRLDLLSAREVYLHEGRAKVRMDGHGGKFALVTDEFRVVDLGTEFGVWAAPGEPDEAHVLEGAVKVSGSGKIRVVKAGESVSSAGNPTEYRPGLFHFGRSQDEPVPTGRDLLKISGAKLKQDSRLVIHFPMEENSGSSIENESTRGGAPREAVITGAEWVPGRFPGKSALSFSGPADAARLSVPGKFESITLCAWVRAKSLPNFYNAIFNSDNFNPGNIHWQVERTGGLNLGVAWDDQRLSTLYSKRKIDREPIGKWLHLATTFDPRTGLCAHYVNGKLLGNEIVDVNADGFITIGKASLGNWIDPRKGDGHPLRPWHGEIDSFMLFDAALSRKEIAEIYESSAVPR